MDHSQLAPLAPRSGLARYSSGGVGSTGAAALVHFLRTTRRSLRAAACRTRKEHQDAPARLVVSVDFWQSRRARATGHDSAFACRLRRGETRPGARAPNFAHLRAIFSPDFSQENDLGGTRHASSSEQGRARPLLSSAVAALWAGWQHLIGKDAKTVERVLRRVWRRRACEFGPRT